MVLCVCVLLSLLDVVEVDELRRAEIRELVATVLSWSTSSLAVATGVGAGDGCADGCVVCVSCAVVCVLCVCVLLSRVQGRVLCVCVSCAVVCVLCVCVLLSLLDVVEVDELRRAEIRELVATVLSWSTSSLAVATGVGAGDGCADGCVVCVSCAVVCVLCVCVLLSRVQGRVLCVCVSCAVVCVLCVCVLLSLLDVVEVDELRRAEIRELVATVLSWSTSSLAVATGVGAGDGCADGCVVCVSCAVVCVLCVCVLLSRVQGRVLCVCVSCAVVCVLCVCVLLSLLDVVEVDELRRAEIRELVATVLSWSTSSLAVATGVGAGDGCADGCVVCVSCAVVCVLCVCVLLSRVQGRVLCVCVSCAVVCVLCVCVLLSLLDVVEVDELRRAEIRELVATVLSWSTSSLAVATGVGAGDGCADGCVVDEVGLTTMAESGMSGMLPPIGAAETVGSSRADTTELVATNEEPAASLHVSATAGMGEGGGEWK